MRFYKIQGEVKKVQYLFKGDFEDADEYVRHHSFHSKIKNTTEKLNERHGGEGFPHCLMD